MSQDRRVAEAGAVSAVQNVIPTTSELTWRDRWVHVLARLGVRRGDWRVAPGLYAVGNPTPQSPVFVTANYALSFDALRSALRGVDGYILVLDTDGINVWCAAGKGTFGTGELVRRIGIVGLAQAVSHRRLILPQLGAPGVAAHRVLRQAGFRVEYGPVRAADLPEYLRTGQAAPDMRRVRFDLADRLVLVPVELVHMILPMLLLSALAYLLGGGLASLAVVAAVLAGVVLFPVLLPWIPSGDFSSKGFILGALVSLPLAVAAVLDSPAGALGLGAARALALVLVVAAATAYLALNFTGATPLTSRSGVKAEIYAYVPVMGWSAGVGVLLLLASQIAGSFVG